MAAEAPTTLLESAWRLIPSARGVHGGVGSFTRTRVERIISLVAGLGSLALGMQAFLTALGPYDERPAWHTPLMIGVFGPLAVMILACLVGRGVRISAGVFALAYVLALIAWPIATVQSAPEATSQPWIWYLVNIATLAAVLAFPMPLQIVWTAAVPLMYGLVRLIQVGFSQEFIIGVALDVSFALILGSMLLTLGWVFRSVAAGVDQTRAQAVASYAEAAAADALEQERVEVAALMHDSVLAALIAAERAETPRERALAVTMAREALTRLANTEQDSREGTDEPRTPDDIADAIEQAARELGADLRAVRTIDDEAPALPGRIAAALALAATQAVANALQHAGGAGLTLTVAGDHDGVDISVVDRGEGFDVDSVEDDRLGIRASILARVAAVGATASIASGQDGTVVTIRWRRRIS